MKIFLKVLVGLHLCMIVGMLIYAVFNPIILNSDRFAISFICLFLGLIISERMLSLHEFKRKHRKEN